MRALCDRQEGLRKFHGSSLSHRRSSRASSPANCRIDRLQREAPRGRYLVQGLTKPSSDPRYPSSFRRASLGKTISVGSLSVRMNSPSRCQVFRESEWDEVVIRCWRFGGHASPTIRPAVSSYQVALHLYVCRRISTHV